MSHPPPDHGPAKTVRWLATAAALAALIWVCSIVGAKPVQSQERLGDHGVDHVHAIGDDVENPGMWVSPADGESGCCNEQKINKDGNITGDCRPTIERFSEDGELEMLRGHDADGRRLWIKVPPNVVFKEPSKDGRTWICEMNGTVLCAKRTGPKS